MATPRVEHYKLAVPVISKTPLGVRTIPEIEEALISGADIVHVDIMDGKYVKRKALGPDVIYTLREELGDDVYIEAHLMAREPDVQPCIDAGADCVILQASGYKDPVDLFADMWRLRKNKVDAGIAFRPDEMNLYLDPAYDSHLKLADTTVFMTAFPGQRTRRAFPGVIKSIKEYRGIDEECHIQADGGIDTRTIRRAKWAGADIFVASPSVVFNGKKISTNIRNLRSAMNYKRKPVHA